MKFFDSHFNAGGLSAEWTKLRYFYSRSCLHKDVSFMLVLIPKHSKKLWRTNSYPDSNQDTRTV